MQSTGSDKSTHDTGLGAIIIIIPGTRLPGQPGISNGMGTSRRGTARRQTSPVLLLYFNIRKNSDVNLEYALLPSGHSDIAEIQKLGCLPSSCSPSARLATFGVSQDPAAF